MNYWLVKSEPSTWSWDQQVAKGAKGEAWTGVRNFTARQNLVKMKKGDLAFFYHSNEGKEIVGIAEIIKEAYPDPTDKSEKFVCVDIKAGKPLKTPVTMAAIKADDAIEGNGAGEIFPAVGAAGDGGGMEDRLQDGRDVTAFVTSLSPCSRASIECAVSAFETGEGLVRRSLRSRIETLIRRFAPPSPETEKDYAAAVATTCASSCSRFDCER